jgi:hypothetical protein
MNVIQLCLWDIKYYYCSVQNKICNLFVNYNKKQTKNKNIIRAAQVRFDFRAAELGLRGSLIRNLIKNISTNRELDDITTIS